MEVNNS